MGEGGAEAVKGGRRPTSAQHSSPPRSPGTASETSAALSSHTSSRPMLSQNLRLASFGLTMKSTAFVTVMRHQEEIWTEPNPKWLLGLRIPRYQWSFYSGIKKYLYTSIHLKSSMVKKEKSYWKEINHCIPVIFCAHSKGFNDQINVCAQKKKKKRSPLIKFLTSTC